MAWKTLGWRAAFLSEIDAFPRAVLKHHYPHVPLRGDFTEIQSGDHDPIDILVGGTPCQSFSTAGLRGGLADERGNLALEYLKLANRLKPRYLVWENVPGVLSSGSGDDFVSFLDGLEEIGYVADVDILDAQFFGLAQRRRRVFVCAERAENILTAKTLSSGLTLAQCLTEISLLCLIAHSDRSIPERESLGFDASNARSSLQRRMRLFGLDSQPAERVSMLADSLAAIHAWSGCGQCASGLVDGSVDSGISEAIRSSALMASEGWRGGCLNTGLSWSGPLADLLQTANECITSIAPSATMASKIYSCAWTTLRITALITQSMHSCPSFWSAASSASIAMKAFTNYARSASSDLLTGLEWLHPWRDFLAQADPASQSLGSLRYEPHARTLLPVSQSLRGNPAPRRETGKGSAATLSACTKGGGGLGTDFDCDGGLIAQDEVFPINEVDSARNSNGIGVGESGDPIPTIQAGKCHGVAVFRTNAAGQIDCQGDKAAALTGMSDPCAQFLAFGGNNTSGPIVATACNAHGGAGRMDFETETFVTHTRLGDGFDASEDVTGRGTPVAPVSVALRGRDGGGAIEIGDECAHALRSSQGGGDKPYVLASAVRRLTPRECERLQGFRDDYTLVPYRGSLAADGPRYKALGNSMAVPVMSWIGRRISMADKFGGSDVAHETGDVCRNEDASSDAQCA